MATAKDFSKLGDIDGVSSYILVRNDGYVVSENYGEAVALSSAIVTSGEYCDSLAGNLAGRSYIYCSIERDSGNDVLVFSLGKYYLGVIKHADTIPGHLADTTIAFLKNLS